MTAKTSHHNGHQTGRILTATAMALVLGAGLSGCSTIQKINPLKKEEPKEVATQGERISIVAFEQKVQPSERLAGKDFYLPSPQPVADWPFASGPTTTVEHAAAAEQFKIAWSKSVGTGSSRTAQVVASPVSDGKVIYAMDGEARIRAFDVNSGNELWTRDLNPDIRRDKDAFGGGLAVSGGKLYVTSGFRLAAAVNASTGEVLWTKTFDSPLRAAPAVNGNVVVFSDVDNQIIALNKETGEPAWTYQALVEPARILRTPRRPSMKTCLSRRFHRANWSASMPIAVSRCGPRPWRNRHAPTPFRKSATFPAVRWWRTTSSMPPAIRESFRRWMPSRVSGAGRSMPIRPMPLGWRAMPSISRRCKAS